MAVNSTDILLFASGTDPKIVARCAYKPDIKTFLVEALHLGEDPQIGIIKLGGPPIAIPESLVGPGNVLKAAGTLPAELHGAYAALCVRLTDLEIDREAGLFGLPATVKVSVKASVTLPPLSPQAKPQAIGFRAQCYLTLAAPRAHLSGRLDFTVAYSAKLPTLSGTFGWPSFGFNFAVPDFSDFKLIGRLFDLPDPSGWLPKTKIVWTKTAPQLQLTLDRELSLEIGVEGAPATGKIELDGKEILDIAAFKIVGPLGDLAVTLDLKASGSADVPPGDIKAGPLTIAWRDTAVSATLDKTELVVTTKVGRLAVSETGKAERIVVALDVVTRYTANGLASKVENLKLKVPTGAQLGAIAMRELGDLKRFVIPLTLPQIGVPEPLLAEIGALGRAIIAWLGAGLGAAGGALIGLGKGAAALADWIFDCLGELGASGAQLVLELRWDAAGGKLKQVVVSRFGAPVTPRAFTLGELKIAFPAVSQPMLIFDLVDDWMAVAVAPQTAAFEATFSTDLWVGGATGTTAVRGEEAKPLIQLKASIPPKSEPEPVALFLLRDGRARFFQSLGGGPAEALAGVLSIGSPLVPGPFDSNVKVDIEIDQDRLTAIFPKGSGSSSASSTAPKVTVKHWEAKPGTGSLQEIEVDLEVLVGGAKSDPIEAKVTGSFDVRTFELRFDALEIPIGAPEPIDFFGARATIVPNDDKHAFVLRVDEAASIALATGARAELRFDGIGEGDDVLTFDAEGPKGLALGASGLDLDAKVRENPVRLPGLDTPFRFTGGAIRVESGRFIAAGITGSGALPPALLGEAKIDAGIQFTRNADGALVVESATARLERAGEPLVCESTRFHFELTHVGLGFKLIDSKVQFFGELTGSATFQPNQGEFANGLLSRLPQIKISFERAPIAGDGRALAKAMKFQIPINPPARAKLFDLFEFELRGIGFHPAYDGWSDTPPTLSLSGQARMTESFDIVQTDIEAHQLYITRPAPDGTLPRVRMDGLGIGLRIAAMGEFSATAIAVDGALPSLFKPDVLPANVTVKGFLASGRLMLKGWAAMSGAAGFLELSPKDESANISKRLSFYIYAEQKQLSEPIPTPVGTLYLREIGFGFGFRYTLAALAQTDQLTDPRDIITTLDPLSRTQGELSAFPNWQPELEGNRLTLAMRALFSVTTASSASVYNAEREKDLDNPVLFDVVAALRSDLTFLLSARAWISVNYADWLNGPKDWHEKPILRGYIYISAPKRMFLGRLIVDPKGHIGEHPKLPKPLIEALGYVKSATATIYITPDLFHQELGWPYELQLALGDPKGTFHAALSGGMVLRIEDGAVLHGIAFRADGHVRVGGRGGGSVGASAQALATFALDGKFIAYVSVVRPADSIFYGRLSLALSLDFTIEFWVDTKFFSLNASWSEKIDVEIDLELAVSPSGLGGHARASLSLRRFGRGLRLGVSLGFHENLLGAARGRVERFMALGLGATVPDPATGLPPLPETARAARAIQGDTELENLAKRRESLPLPNSDMPEEPGKPAPGDPITACDFWAIVMPLRGKRGEALLHLVPKDSEPKDERDPAVKAHTFFGTEAHGDFFVAPLAYPDADDHRRGGGHYVLTEQDPKTPVLGELKVPKGQVAGMPLWDKVVDAKSGSTLGDLVAGGFLGVVDGKLTQPMTAPSDGKAKRDGLGCIEARGALIGHVAEQVRRLAESWTDALNDDTLADFDPRWFGLTFKIGDGTEALETLLAKLFPPIGDGAGPRPASFTIAKSDVDGPPEGLVELFNPVERWFENAQPRLAQPRAFMRDQTIRLAWDLEPRWGASQGRYDDPEYHLMHYAVQRHIEVTADGSRRFHASWLAKGAETIDLIEGTMGRDYQVIDRLENLTDAVRKALLLLAQESPDWDTQQPAAHEDAFLAWQKAFGNFEIDGGRGDGTMDRASVNLVYSVVPIDNSGTKGDPSPPIRLPIFAPLPPRAKPLSAISLSFDYFARKTSGEAFPKSLTHRPMRLTIAIAKKDRPQVKVVQPRRKAQIAVEAAWPAIDLYFDITREPRLGIFGADLLDADRHRHRVVSPDRSYTTQLLPGVATGTAIPVKLRVIDPDQTDPCVDPETKDYYLPRDDFDELAKTRVAAQIYARFALTGEEPKERAAPWTRCDLKLRVSRGREKASSEPRWDDFLSPIAEFEQPMLSVQRLLAEEDISAEQGILYRTSPDADAVLEDGPAKTHLARDPNDRRAIRLAWKARPLRYCDGTVIDPDRIGGFDLFVASRDRETDPVLEPAALARLAQPLGRILVKPRALLNSEPALIEDFSKLDVAYPSAASSARGEGWYSAAESRLIWPKPVPRRSLMLVPDEGLIGEIFAKGRPTGLKIRLETIEEAPATLLLALGGLDDLAKPPPPARVKLEADVDGWRGVTFASGEATPGAMRELMQRLIWAFDDTHVPMRAQLKFKHAGGEHVVEVALGSEIHPILADLLDLLRYHRDDFAAANGYRRYEPVLEGAPSPVANAAETPKETAQKPQFAQLLSDTAAGSDKAGWAALRQLGLAVGFRLWDTQASDWVDPGEHRDVLGWAWRQAMARCDFALGDIGAPFLEQFYDPEELFVLGGEDLLREPRQKPLAGMPLIQASLRPVADRLLDHPDPFNHRYSVHYLTLTVAGARIRASELSDFFGTGSPTDPRRVFVQLLVPSASEQPGASVWVGSEGAQVEGLQPETDYLFAPGLHEVLARVVLADEPLESETVQGRLSEAIRQASGPDARVAVRVTDWSPADGRNAPVPNPYLRFEAVPAELAGLVEASPLVPADGRKRLMTLAARRFEIPERPGPDMALALQRWEKRFFDLGAGVRVSAKPPIGLAFATMDAPASLRRAPDAKGRISILYLDEGGLGSWRRFYIRPFGRHDHLAQASGWLEASEMRLEAADFGAAPGPGDRPWVDVTLARSREIPKPVLLASTYSAEAGALVLVAARSDQDVLASANVPQAGAAQIGGVDVGFNCKLDEPRSAWATALLTSWEVMPELTAAISNPPDTATFQAWLLERATPPRPKTALLPRRGVPAQPLPDLWRGATAVAAYDLPYFFSYSAQLAASAGAATSLACEAELPSPPPVDFAFHDVPTWEIDGTDVIIRLPLARFADCMDAASKATWYRTRDPSTRLFELPDPAIVYRIYLRSPLGDMWSSEIDVEAEPARATYSALATGQTFADAHGGKPVRDGDHWSVTVRASAMTFDEAAADMLVVVPVRQTHAMPPVKIEKAP